MILSNKKNLTLPIDIHRTQLIKKNITLHHQTQLLKTITLHHQISKIWRGARLSHLILEVLYVHE